MKVNNKSISLVSLSIIVLVGMIVLMSGLNEPSHAQGGATATVNATSSPAQGGTLTPSAPTTPAAGGTQTPGAMMTPTISMEGSSSLLQEVAKSPDRYFGQPVTVIGLVGRLISPRVFIVDEGAALDNDGLLVINTSAQELSGDVMQGNRVQVTGVVRQSINLRQEAQNNTTPTAAATVDVAMQPTMDATMQANALTLEQVLGETDLNDFANYTILEVSDANAVTYSPAIGAITNDPGLFYGRPFVIEGRVGRLVTENSFILSDGQAIGARELLVFYGGTEVLTGIVAEGQNVRVRGVVRQYNAPEIGRELGREIDAQIYRDYENYTVLVADSIVPANNGQ
jgi:hypothetical protein